MGYKKKIHQLGVVGDSMRKRILVRGPALSRSGYGEQTRFALRALRHHEDKFDIFLNTTSWGATSWITEDNEERQWIDNLLQKTISHVQSGGSFDVSLQVTIPGEFEQVAPVNIGYTAGIETTKISTQWLEKTYLMNKIIVPSEHAKSAFETTSFKARNPEGQIVDVGCITPVEAVSFPAKFVPAEELDISLDTPFNFLNVAQLSPRKNFDNCLRWFVEEFHDDADVGLVVKINLAKNCLLDRRATQERLTHFLSEYPDRKCKVYLLHGSLSDGQMSSLYSKDTIKAIVSTTHGEGFGLPLFEAVQAELPVVAPNWSGHKDFLYMPVPEKGKKSKKTKSRPMFAKVDYQLKPVQPEAVWQNVIIPESMWCFPKERSFKNALRSLYKDDGLARSQAKKLRAHIEKTLASETQYDAFVRAMGLSFQASSASVEDLLGTGASESDIEVHS